MSRYTGPLLFGALALGMLTATTALPTVAAETATTMENAEVQDSLSAEPERFRRDPIHQMPGLNI